MITNILILTTPPKIPAPSRGHLSRTSQLSPLMNRCKGHQVYQSCAGCSPTRLPRSADSFLGRLCIKSDPAKVVWSCQACRQVSSAFCLSVPQAGFLALFQCPRYPINSRPMIGSPRIPCLLISEGNKFREYNTERNTRHEERNQCKEKQMNMHSR